VGKAIGKRRAVNGPRSRRRGHRSYDSPRPPLDPRLRPLAGPPHRARRALPYSFLTGPTH
jgi:hypothetical protein